MGAEAGYFYEAGFFDGQESPFLSAFARSGLLGVGSESCFGMCEIGLNYSNDWSGVLLKFRRVVREWGIKSVVVSGGFEWNHFLLLVEVKDWCERKKMMQRGLSAFAFMWWEMEEGINENSFFPSSLGLDIFLGGGFDNFVFYILYIILIFPLTIPTVV